jgi:DNA-binding SARP family transcriptional activator
VEDGPVSEQLTAARFGLLGPLRVEDGEGQILAVPAAKQRVVLAALLLSANATVSIEKLAGALWGASPPRNVTPVVRTYVMRLRRTLGGTGSRIVSQPAGYLLRLPNPAEFDVAEVELLLQAGREATEASQWSRASESLSAALSRWRGAPLADVFSDSLRNAALPRLAELRLRLTEARIDADLQQGRHGDLIAELRALTAEHPLRERFRAQFMLACYRSGRQAEALEAYRDARATLIAELGVEPTPELRDLHERILAADTGLAGARPAHAAERRAGPGGRPGGEPGRTVPRQLPATVRHFAGRAAELTELTGRARESAAAAGTVAISVISGTAGIGKTALALHWAHQEASRFGDGQLYVNLRGFDPSDTPVTAAEAIRGFLDALQVPADRIPVSPTALSGLYRSLLAGKRMLIMLDNARDERQVRPLLPASPGCLVLVTSRSQLTGLAAADGAHLLTLDVLAVEDARELLARRLGTARVAAEQEAAAELSALCALLPLALNIMAARAAARPEVGLAALAAELRDGRSRLDALSAPDADTDVRAVFSWSYRALSSAASGLFRLISLHPTGEIGVAAAASLAAVPPAQARALLRQLTGAQLLAEPAPGRFACHDLLRIFAAEQARAAGSETERRSAAHRMLDHYLHGAFAAELLLSPRPSPVSLPEPQPGTIPAGLADRAQAVAWLGTEYQALLAVTRYAAAHGFETHAWQIPLFLGSYFDMTARWADWAAAQEVALAAAEQAGDVTGQANGRHYLGFACIRLRRFPEARRHLRQALTRFRQVRDQLGEAHAHSTFAIACRLEGRHALALAHGREALQLYREAGYQRGQANALNAIGWFHAHLGNHGEALASCRQALGLNQQIGNEADEAATWDSLGYAHHLLGHHTEAIACYQHAIDMFGRVGHQYLAAASMAGLGNAQDAAGDQDAARHAWQQALAILDDLRHPQAEEIRARLAWPEITR